MYDTSRIQPEGWEVEVSRESEGIQQERAESPRCAFKVKSLPPVERVRRMLSYDSATGEMIWMEGRNEGRTAGTVAKDGYRWIKIDRKRYPAHRLAWLHHYGTEPNGPLDHKNTVGIDNWITNLREATAQQNVANTKPYGSSGIKGAYLRKNAKKWIALIYTAGKSKYLGSFETKEEAGAAYASAARELFGEFARSN